MKKLFFLGSLLIVSTAFSQIQSSLKCGTTNKKAIELYNNGNFGLLTNRLEGAKLYYLAAVKEDSSFCDAWDNLSVCYRRLGEYNNAFNSSLKSLTIDSVNEVAWTNCGYATFLNNDIYSALNSFDHLQRIIPTSPEGYYGKAFVYYSIDSISSALENINKAILIYRTVPTTAELLKGFIQYKSGETIEAQMLFEKVYSKHKDDPKLNFYLSQCYLKNENSQKKAEKYQKKAFALGFKTE